MEYKFTSHAFDPRLPTFAPLLGQFLAHVLAVPSVVFLRVLDATPESGVHRLSCLCYPRVAVLVRFVPQRGSCDKLFMAGCTMGLLWFAIQTKVQVVLVHCRPYSLLKPSNQQIFIELTHILPGIESRAFGT